MTRARLALVLVGLALAWPAAARAASFAYITNSQNNVVSVINTSTEAVAQTINVGSGPRSVAVNAAGTRVYVANELFAPPTFNPSISVINTLSNAVVATIDISTDEPHGVAVNPAGTLVYVT